jgi:hypothetical protein
MSQIELFFVFVDYLRYFVIASESWLIHLISVCLFLPWIISWVLPLMHGWHCSLTQPFTSFKNQRASEVIQHPCVICGIVCWCLNAIPPLPSKHNYMDPLSVRLPSFHLPHPAAYGLLLQRGPQSALQFFSYPSPSWIVTWNSLMYSRLALDSIPPACGLLCSWDYKCEPPCPTCSLFTLLSQDILIF